MGEPRSEGIRAGDVPQLFSLGISTTEWRWRLEEVREGNMDGVQFGM